MPRSFSVTAIAFSITAFFACPAHAGVGGEIAYSVSRDVYLVNQDGTGKRLLYRGAIGTKIFAISIKPDGGEMSFEEVGKTGQTARLITISYGASGSATVTRNIGGCRWDVSTRNDGALLVVDSCDHTVKFFAAGATTPSQVATPGPASKVSWLADGSFLYTSGDKIRMGTLASPSGTEVAAQNCVQNLDAAHSASEALVSVGSFCGAAMYRLAVPSGTKTMMSVTSPAAAYSQDDSCFIYIAKTRKSGYLMIAPVSEASSPVQFGNSADYGSVDWRGDSQPKSCPIASSNSAFEFRIAP